MTANRHLSAIVGQAGEEPILNSFFDVLPTHATQPIRASQSLQEHLTVLLACNSD